MYPHERSLVKQLAGKPFALIGVNSDDDLETIRKVATRKNITWRSFQNESSTGTISEKWGVQGWPTVYVIDAKGTIRYRGHEVDDSLIEELLGDMGHEVKIKFDDPGEKPRKKRKRKNKKEQEETKAEKEQPYWATLPANNKADCEAAGGYWHNGKCWKNFSDDAGIKNDEIDRIVAQQLKQIAKTKLTLDGTEHPIEFAFPEMEDGEATLIVGFKDMQEFLLIECSEEDILNGGSFNANTAYVKGNLLEAEDENDIEFAGTGILRVQVKDDFEINVEGSIDLKSNKTIEVSAYINEAIIGAGNSKLEIKDGQAFLSGALGTVTYPQVKNLIESHPEIKTLTLTEVEGSVNDAINMHTGRILREAGLNTRVLPDSEIASGGVDLYCAGVKRYGAKTAKVGVHSWGGQGYTAGDLPKDHPDHQFQIAFFSRMLGGEAGKKFYFYTLEAAPFESVHWMSADELKQWNVVTDWSK